ncbi:MAG: ABC transporter ATP-binding protein [Clostridium sp.]|nr:ABC transporter ATP-binding protein [Clostridium sp.]
MGDRLKRQIYKNNIFYFISTIIVTIGVSFVDGIMALIFKYALDMQGSMTKLIFITISVIVGYILFQGINIYVSNEYSRRAMINLRASFIDKLLNKRVKDFQKENIGNYLSAINNDMTVIERDYVTGQILILLYSVRILVSAIIMCILNYKMFLAALLVIILPVIILKIANNTLMTRQKEVSDFSAGFNVLTKEILSGFPIIKSFNVEKKVEEKIFKESIELENSKTRLYRLNDSIDSLTTALTLCSMLGTFVVGMILVSKGYITIGTVTAEVQLMTNLFSLIKPLVKQFGKFLGAKSIFLKLDKMIESDDVELEESGKKSFESAIRIKDISFSYDEEKQILDNINFEFKKNKSYLILGESGCGKSTLLKLLMGYYDNFQGQVLIDDVDIRKINSIELSKILSVIQQDVFIFDDTLRNNLTLYCEYDDDALEKVAKKVYMDEFTKIHGMDYECGENGENLSGGQKQRISIGRAILRNTPILLLDEVTSSLDPKVARSIENLIIELKDVTRIVVTHRMNKETLKKYDEIIILKDGKIVEHGSCEELILHKGEFYKNFKIYNDK